MRCRQGQLLGITPTIGPITAIGLVVVMAGATVVHIPAQGTGAMAIALAVLAAAAAVFGFLTQRRRPGAGQGAFGEAGQPPRPAPAAA